MTRVRIAAPRCALVCAAAMLIRSNEVVAQFALAPPPTSSDRSTFKDTTAGDRSAAQKKGASRKPAAATRTQTPAGVKETGEVKTSRHIGKMHHRLRVHREHHKQAGGAVDTGLFGQYLDFKETLERDQRLTFIFSPTIMTQWGRPDGGPPSTQIIVSPDVEWKTEKTAIGEGAIHFSYTSNRYYAGGQSGASLQSRLNLLNSPNDTPVSNRTFNQLTYSHDFPGERLLIGIGQFPIANFDQNAYAGNQLLNFISFSMAQNASQTYPVASLGAFVQITPIAETLELVVGFQDANNISGNNIQTASLRDGPVTSFAYAQWTPKIPGLGDTKFSLLYYSQPAVPLQPAVSEGWSFNATQDLERHWGFFLRANATTGLLSPIKNSVAAGIVYRDLLGRGLNNDQIGLGISRNATNMDFFVGQAVRSSEWVVEAYLNVVVAQAWLFGPDVQLYINPALNPAQGSAQVYTLRLTGLF